MISTASDIDSCSTGVGNLPHLPCRIINSTPAAAHDSVLVRQFQDGDENAFVEIVARYRAKMFSIALSHLRNPDDAEEVAQDTLIRAHRGLARFRGDSSLSTWLHRIAFNLSRNRHKHNFCRRRHLMLSLDSQLGDENEATLSGTIASDAPCPAQQAATREFSEFVDICIRKLGIRQREILQVRNGLSESYSDIAHALGISIGTVKSRIGRARENLRLLVAERYPDIASDTGGFSILEPMRSSGRFTFACA